MGLNLDPLPLSLRRAAVFVLCAGWFAMLAWWHRNVVIDDPWITFRYAENVLAGEGWVFNRGEPLEGYSNFTWVWATMVALWANVEPLGFARLLGCVSALGIVALLCFGNRAWNPDEADMEAGWWLPRSGTAALLLVSCYPVAVWAMGGLETTFHALLVFLWCLSLAWIAARGDVYTALFAGGVLTLLGMTRPEGPMFAAALSVLYLATRDRARRNGYLVAGLTFLLLYGIYTIWRYSIFGTLVPNTVTAKVGGEAERSLGAGLVYFMSYFGSAPALLLALAIGGLVRRTSNEYEDADDASPRRAMRMACGVAVGMQLVFAVAVGGDWMPSARFFVPMLAPMCVLAAFAIRGLPFFVRWVIVGFFLLAGLVHAKRDPMLNWCRWAAREQGGTLLVAPLVDMGLYIRDASATGDVLAATEAGVMPYYSGLRFIDMLGIVDPHIASLPGGLHEKFDAGYVLAREPDFIALQFTELNGTPEPTWAPDRDVYTHAGFGENYREIHRIERLMNDGEWGLARGWLVLYERRRDAAGPDGT